MTGIVVDASAVAALLLPDEDVAYAVRVLDTLSRSSGYVPALFWFEVWNVLAINVSKRRRISEQDASECLGWLAELQLEVAPLPQANDVLRLAYELDVTVYDAAYIELAQRLGLPLATLDNKMRESCRRTEVGVSLFA